MGPGLEKKPGLGWEVQGPGMGDGKTRNYIEGREMKEVQVKLAAAGGCAGIIDGH
jgi:hypothetical protein